MHMNNDIKELGITIVTVIGCLLCVAAFLTMILGALYFTKDMGLDRACNCVKTLDKK